MLREIINQCLKTVIKLDSGFGQAQRSVLLPTQASCDVNIQLVRGIFITAADEVQCSETIT